MKVGTRFTHCFPYDIAFTKRNVSLELAKHAMCKPHTQKKKKKKKKTWIQGEVQSRQKDVCIWTSATHRELGTLRNKARRSHQLKGQEIDIQRRIAKSNPCSVSCPNHLKDDLHSWLFLMEKLLISQKVEVYRSNPMALKHLRPK